MIKHLVLPLLLFQFFFTKAQTGFDNLYKAIEIPSHQILNINIDGKIDDWGWIPDVYKYRFEDCMIINGATGRTDFEGFFSLAWSKETNWMYFMACVKDDVINVDTIRSHYYNDKIELAFNFGECTENEKNNQYTEPKNLVWLNLFCNYLSKTKSKYLVSLGPDWIKDKRYLKFNSTVNKTKEGKYIINYELGMVLWEDISKDGPEYSKEFVLENNKELKFYVSYRDYDVFFNELKNTYIYYGRTWCSMPQLNLDPFISTNFNQSNLEILLRK